MFDAQHFVAGQGIWIVLGLIFAGGLGLPLPAPPVLIAAGVLAGTGPLSLLAVLARSFVAVLPPHPLRFHLGPRRGGPLLAPPRPLSLQPPPLAPPPTNPRPRHPTPP